MHHRSPTVGDHRINLRQQPLSDLSTTVAGRIAPEAAANERITMSSDIRLGETIRNVLIIEDEAHDAAQLQNAFSKIIPLAKLQIASNGKDAIDYLSSSDVASEEEGHQLVSLILLDWYLPKINGRDVLKWLRAHAHFQGLPVIVYSGSNDLNDVSDAYACGANGFVSKPNTTEKMLALVRSICACWGT